MKVKKGLFTTEIEFTIDELKQLPSVDPVLVNSILLFLVRILDKLMKGGK